MSTPLPLITTLARSGALDRAWALFRESGYDSADADPAALAVKGRLLKDLAYRQAAGAQSALLAEAEAAYAAADALAPQPWLLINVAALAALQGDQTRAAATARGVLARLDAGNVAETPYFIEATRAEALVLCGDLATAEAALATAMAADADGWSDHATTLRQLGRILDVQKADKAWLDGFRPPRSIHFAGHLGIIEADTSDLRVEVDALLDTERIGFGYGALAAGADIVIAEALLARGAELHISLPIGRPEFFAQSVLAYGAAWVPRFEACLEQATSVKEVTSVSGQYEPLATALAGDMAMGAAALNAQMLESTALQLLIVDEGPAPYGNGASTARDGMTWKATGNNQRLITWPRSGLIPASNGKKEGRTDRRMLAVLCARLEGLDHLDDGAFADALDSEMLPFWRQVSSLPDQPTMSHPQGNARLLCFDSVWKAAQFARRLQMLGTGLSFPLTLAGHYGLFHATSQGVIGPSLRVLASIEEGAMSGTITVSEAFVNALALASDSTFRATDLGERGSVKVFAIQ